jgi:hypothetical protein
LPLGLATQTGNRGRVSRIYIDRHLPLGVGGVAAEDSPRDPRRGAGDAISEHQTCFKCHSERRLKNCDSFKFRWTHMQIASCATRHVGGYQRVRHAPSFPRKRESSVATTLNSH